MKLTFSKNYLWLLVGVTVADLAILFVRNTIVGHGAPSSLIWNLFLALVPLLIALGLHLLTNSQKPSKLLIWVGGGLWLLFYPNAPYMVSDLMHVSADPSGLMLYDTMIIFLFAMLALFYGFFSIKIMQGLYDKICSPNWGRAIIIGSIVVASFGIYLGRILRLNSWDIFTQPMKVLADVIDHLFPVTKNPTTYAIIFLFSFIQFTLLACMKSLEAPVERNAPQQG